MTSGTEVVKARPMTCIVQRQDRFYVVAYDGLHPLTGKERPIPAPRRLVERSPVPAIRFHDLRHTHASLLIAAGVPVKVVSERLGHSHPGFTMKTYQHVMPGMSAAAADQFATLIATATR